MRIFQYKNDKDYSDLRWTLDTVEDFKLIDSIYNYLYTKKGNNFIMEDILQLLKDHTELIDINKDVKRKQIDRG